MKGTKTAIGILSVGMSGLIWFNAVGVTDGKGRINITITGLKNTRGRAIVSLYRQGENWLKIDRAFKTMIAPIQAVPLTVSLEEIPYDTYAISIIHDENDNGKLDMRWFPWPKPKEGAGVSNNSARRTGPPEYEKARFAFKEDGLSLEIRMQY